MTGKRLLLRWGVAAALGISPALADALAAAGLQQRTVWDAVYTDAQAKRGAAVYDASCASCHGADLAGADVAPPLSGFEFGSNWDGQTLDALVERIRRSMPQGAPGSLTRQESVDVVAFMLSKGGLPAGPSELGVQADALARINYRALKP